MNKLPFCTKCGTKVVLEALFCSNCGNRVSIQTEIRESNGEKQIDERHVDDFEASFLRLAKATGFSDLPEKTRRERFLNSFSVKQLEELATEYDIELDEKVLLKSSPSLRKDNLVLNILKSRLSENAIKISFRTNFLSSPVQEANPETVERYRSLFYNPNESIPGFLRDSEGWNLLLVDKFQAWFAQAHAQKENDFCVFLKEEVGHYKPEERYDLVNFSDLYNLNKLFQVSDTPKYIEISNSVVKRKDLIMALRIIGNGDIDVFSMGRDNLVFLMNSSGETIVLTNMLKKIRETVSFIPRLKEIVEMNPPIRPKREVVAWKRLLGDWIDLSDESDFFNEMYGEESEKTLNATFPRDRVVLIAAWEYDINHWQPTFIEYTEKEIQLWDEIKKSPELPEDAISLIHTIQINRSIALSRRKELLKILTKQLTAMRNRDHRKVNSLFSEMLKWMKARNILKNDVSHLLTALCDVGVLIPKRHIPKVKTIREEDYEVGNHIIKKLIPVPMPNMRRVSNPWMAEYEEFLQNRRRSEAKLRELQRYVNTNDWYLSTMNQLKEARYRAASQR